MAINVFGKPITNNTLKVMPKYHGKTITRRDRAHVALNGKNVEDKYKKAKTKTTMGNWSFYHLLNI